LRYRIVIYKGLADGSILFLRSHGKFERLLVEHFVVVCSSSGLLLMRLDTVALCPRMIGVLLLELRGGRSRSL